MSLDVYLKTTTPIPKKFGTGVFVRQRGQIVELNPDEVLERFPEGNFTALVPESDDQLTDILFESNMTHNMSEMAAELGIFDAVWRPDTVGIVTAIQLIPILESAIAELEEQPEHYKTFNPDNGWGDYDGFLNFLKTYLAGCTTYPDGLVEVSR